MGSRPAIPEFLDETNIRSIVREGDVVLLAVDNPPGAGPRRSTISDPLADAARPAVGGNDELDVHVVSSRRADES